MAGHCDIEMTPHSADYAPNPREVEMAKGGLGGEAPIRRRDSYGRRVES